MDQLISKSVKRCLWHYKEYSKQRRDNKLDSVHYTARSETAEINMTESNPNTDTSRKYLETHFDTTTVETIKNVSFNESIQTKNISNVSLFSENEILNLDNNIEIVRIKMFEEPVKETPKISNISRNIENSIIQNNLNDSVYSNGDILIENSTQHPSIIKIKVKVINKNKTITEYCNSDDSDNGTIEDNNNIDVNKTLIPEYNSSIIPESKPVEEFQNFSSEKHNVNDTCIFDGNKNRPLSPISKFSPEVHRYRNVEDLVQLHERIIRKSPPKMGTNALFRESKTKLNDSEIISALVRDRFIVNMYESRSFRRNSKKPSTYGRIYKSLERAVRRYDSKQNLFNNDIINVSQSSPIKLNDQMISLQTTQNNYETSSESNSSTSTVDQICENIKNVSISEEQFTQNNSREILSYQTEFVMPSSEYGSGSNSIQNSTISLDKQLQGSQSLFENTFGSNASSYNMEEFLKKALGDELHNLDLTEIETKEILVQPKILHEESICTSNASDLISKINTLQSNFYRSFTKSIQQMTGTLRQNQESQNTNSVKSDADSLFSDNEEVAVLLKQAAVQYEALKQISKALILCGNSKEFCVSNEQVEAERLLLLATHKRQSILDEIRRIEYSTDPEIIISETGSLTITNITLPLKASTPESPKGRELTKWYVAIVSSGLQVTATKATLAAGDGNVKFMEKMVFKDLPTHFEVNVDIYCLLQRRLGKNFSHESKYHINKDSKRSRCPTPKKFLSREKAIQKLPARSDTEIRTSSFRLCGNLKLTVGDLNKSAPWDLRGKIPLCSSLTGNIILNLNSLVQIPISQSGFLTVGSESGSCTSWNRRWCVLNDHAIKYWNYPSEEESSNAVKQIDLKYCINSTVHVADRSLCARPRTLLLEIAREPESENSNSTTLTCSKPYIIERHYLSADNIADLNIWQQQLDKVVQALRIWNVGFKF